MSLGDAAKEIGVTVPTLRRAEEGSAVNPATARKISEFYGVPAEEWHPEFAEEE